MQSKSRYSVQRLLVLLITKVPAQERLSFTDDQRKEYKSRNSMYPLARGAVHVPIISWVRISPHPRLWPLLLDDRRDLI